jgi:hypothetical protein
MTGARRSGLADRGVGLGQCRPDPHPHDDVAAGVARDLGVTARLLVGELVDEGWHPDAARNAVARRIDAWYRSTGVRKPRLDPRLPEWPGAAAPTPRPTLPPVARAADTGAASASAQQLTESGRRGRQVEEILARLRRGPATNDELARIARKYTSRVSDARALGHLIVCRRLAGGLTEYRLEVNCVA